MALIMAGCSNKFSEDEIDEIVKQQDSVYDMLTDMCEYSKVIKQLNDYYVDEQLTKEEYEEMITTADSKLQMYDKFYKNIDINSIIKYNEFLKDYDDISQKKTDEKIKEVSDKYEQGKNIIRYYLCFMKEVEENEYVLDEHMWARYNAIGILCDAYMGNDGRDSEDAEQWEETLNKAYD